MPQKPLQKQSSEGPEGSPGGGSSGIREPADEFFQSEEPDGVPEESSFELSSQQTVDFSFMD